jgi:hypothetical protein
MCFVLTICFAGRWRVDDVTSGSPIAKAGIEVDDVLMKVAKEDVISAQPSLDDIEARLKKVGHPAPISPILCSSSYLLPVPLFSISTPSPSPRQPRQGQPRRHADINAIAVAAPAAAAAAAGQHRPG